MPRRLTQILLALGAFTSGACYDPVFGVGAGDTGVVEDPTHDVNIQPIWDSTCGPGCHEGGAASGGLALDDGYAATVGQASSAGLSYIEPGDPDSSYLWLKLQGEQADAGGSGSKMPLTGSLSESALTTINNWISDGAPE